MKTKVIALRVTQDEYDALQAAADFRSVGLYVRLQLSEPIRQGFEKLSKQRKAAEAKAKREAKKAAGNVSE